MTPDEPLFHADLSASPGLAEPAKGLVAQFDLVDGRRVDIHVPMAVYGAMEPCAVSGFRVVVWRPDGVAMAVLSATDLLDVFGAQSAAKAIAAFVAGDLARAHRLARRAGVAWRGLVPLLREVAGVRRLRRRGQLRRRSD